MQSLWSQLWRWSQEEREQIMRPHYESKRIFVETHKVLNVNNVERRKQKMKAARRKREYNRKRYLEIKADTWLFQRRRECNTSNKRASRSLARAATLPLQNDASTLLPKETIRAWLNDTSEITKPLLEGKGGFGRHAQYYSASQRNTASPSLPCLLLQPSRGTCSDNTRRSCTNA